MPVTATFHTKYPISPPKQPIYKAPSPYKRPTPDPADEELARKMNDLLDYRSKNISNILAQKEGHESAYAPVTMPPEDPRMESLHKELGIDKVVIVKCPFEIDTTPGGMWHNPLLPPETHSQTLDDGGQGKLRDSWAPGFREAHDKAASGPQPRKDAVEFSANGNTAPAYVDGRLLRGGWAVS